MALDSKYAPHQLEAGLSGSIDGKKQHGSQTSILEPKESHLRRTAMRRKMLAFWIIVSSPFVCFLMTLVISPVFWPGCLSRLHPGLTHQEEAFDPTNMTVDQLQADVQVFVPEEEVLTVAEDVPTLGSRSVIMAKLHRRQDEGANTTSSSAEEETSTEVTSTPVDTPTSEVTTPPADTETSTEISTTTEEISSTTTSEFTTSESSTSEELTTESTTEVTPTPTPTISSTVESETSSPDESTTTPEPTTTTTSEEEESETTTTEEEPSSSSAVVATRTETLDNGVTTVITTTSWVDVAAPSDDGADATDPDLQNAASKPAALGLFSVPIAVLIGVLVA